MSAEMPRARQVLANGVLSEVVTRPATQPGPGEALLRVHATSVNFHDLSGIDGLIPNVPLPRVPFSDASATVEAVGAGVPLELVGSAVIPSFFMNWQAGPPLARNLSVVLGDQVDGTLQTHVVVPAKCLAKAPEGLSHEEIATLGCAGVTAWRSLMVEGAIKPGQTVLLQGTGGVSLFALGFAKMAGARVVITSSSDEKLERARALGADVTINYSANPKWSRAVLEATDGVGADLVVEVGGGSTIGQAVSATRVGGHISVIGILTGRSSEDFALGAVMAKNITIRGITVASTDQLSEMCRAIEHHRFRPLVDAVYDLEDAHEAIAALRKQQHFGKIAIRIG